MLKRYKFFDGKMYFSALMRTRLFFLFIFVSISGLSCKHWSSGTKPPSFDSVFGTRFTEVKRVFASGVSFRVNGYQVTPNWQLTFISTDSVNIYSPGKKRFLNCPVKFDHDSIFNVAWAWLRLRKLTKDSIVFQVLHVQDQVISYNRSIIYMTLYADNYIKNTLHTTAENLQRPTPKDTLFIKKRIAEVTNKTDSSFAATDAVKLVANSPLVKLEQVLPEVDETSQDDPLPTYMLPEYNITIQKAYEDFNYSFSVIVDAQGKMEFYRSTTVMMPEFAEQTKRVIRAILAGYLTHYLRVMPGKTLGMAHASLLLFNVHGKKT